jgi:hypothetical protein
VVSNNVEGQLIGNIAKILVRIVAKRDVMDGTVNTLERLVQLAGDFTIRNSNYNNCLYIHVYNVLLL